MSITLAIVLAALTSAAVAVLIRWFDRPSRATQLDRQVTAELDRCAVTDCHAPWTVSTHGWRTCDEHTPRMGP